MPSPRLGPGAEFELLRRVLERAPVVTAPGVSLGPGDDAALLSDGDAYWAITADLSVEGVHFRLEWIDAREAAARAVRAALSDLAAVAARPVGVLASVSFPASMGPADAESILLAVAASAAEHGAALLGGDVARGAGRLALDVVAVGRCPRPVLRAGARPGDRLWVTGSLGGAAAAVRAWSAGGSPPPELRQRFARPVPRIAEASWLAERGVVSAMIDLSDGLVADAGHLAAAGGVALEIDAAAVPCAPGATSEDSLTGGEDYELLFTGPPEGVESVRAELEATLAVELHPVGRVATGAGVRVFDPAGRRLAFDAAGYDHFRVP